MAEKERPRADGFEAFHDIVERMTREMEEARARQSQGSVRRKGKPPAGSLSPVPARGMDEQLGDLKRRRGLLKKDLSRRMDIDPSYLSQLLERGMAAEKIEEVARAAKIEPQFFDEYVAKIAPEKLLQDRALLDIVRAYLFEADGLKRRAFIARSLRTLRPVLNLDYLADQRR